jgi:hypothetical protein
VTFCPEWELAPHSSIDTTDLFLGTEAKVYCEDGFIFSTGSVVETIKCMTSGSSSLEAVWNVTELTCQRELITFLNFHSLFYAGFVFIF